MAERLWFLGLLVASAVLLLSFGAWRAFTYLSQTFQFFLVQCSKNAGQLIGYCLSYANFWKIVAVVIFSTLLLAFVIKTLTQLQRTFFLQQQLRSKHCADWGQGIHLVLDERPFALTIGFLKPKIYLSSACITTLSERELAAVLTHEQYHKAKLHPLGLVLLRSLAAVLAFVPMVRSWTKFAQIQYELFADRFTLRTHSRTDVASALLKMFEPYPLTHRHVAVAGFSATNARTVFLENKQLPSWSLSKRSGLISLVSMLLFTALLQHVMAAPAQQEITLSPVIQEQLVTCASPAESVVSLMSFGLIDTPMSVTKEVLSSEVQTLNSGQ